MIDPNEPTENERTQPDPPGCWLPDHSMPDGNMAEKTHPRTGLPSGSYESARTVYQRELYLESDAGLVRNKRSKRRKST